MGWDGCGARCSGQGSATHASSECGGIPWKRSSSSSPDTFLHFCLHVCGLPSLKDPLCLQFSISPSHPWSRVDSAIMGQGSMRKDLSLVPLSRQGLAAQDSS